MSYSIIEKHEGNISLESEPGRGTIFRIALPLLPGEPVVTVGQR